MPHINFSVRGSGHPVILLHGFPLNASMWDDFAARLSDRCKVYTPDLPGFGQSEELSENFSLEDVAQALLFWMSEHNIVNSVLIGHSLGGYVALYMAGKNPMRFDGLGLFHSTAMADTAEKKESRTKVVDFVVKNGPIPFTTNFIEPLFADHNNPNIERVRNTARLATASTVIGYTKAMRDRIGQEEVLKTFPRPIIFIAGQKDLGIPTDSLRSQSAICQHSELHIITSAAHMGMFETPDETSTLVRQFVERCESFS